MKSKDLHLKAAAPEGTPRQIVPSCRTSQEPVTGSSAVVKKRSLLEVDEEGTLNMHRLKLLRMQDSKKWYINVI